MCQLAMFLALLCACLAKTEFRLICSPMNNASLQASVTVHVRYEYAWSTCCTVLTYEHKGTLHSKTPVAQATPLCGLCH